MSTPRSATRSQRSGSYDSPSLKLGRHGTSMFKGSDRFASKPKSNTHDVEFRAPKGIAEISLEKAKASTSSSWSKHTTPRFGKDHHQPQTGAGSSSDPKKKAEPTATDLYTPRGVGDIPKTPRGTAAFTQTAPRMASPNRSHSADPAGRSPSRSEKNNSSSDVSMTSAAYGNPPSFVDSILKSKKGTAMFAGKPSSRFAAPKSATADIAEVYNGGGIADTVAKTKSNPMNAGGKAPRFVEKNTRPRSASPANPQNAAPGDVVDVDLFKYTLAGQAEKNKDKGSAWSKRSSARLVYAKPKTDPQEMYVPPAFGSGVKGPNFNRGAGTRFKDPNTKNRLASTSDAGLYEQPSFVDLILKK